MPPQPTFDYYAELELKPWASAQQITSSYRRLALVCHPDRNPDNQQEATACFQRLQLAHETLSDPAQRAHYDDLVIIKVDENNRDDDDDDDGDHVWFDEDNRSYGFPFSRRFENYEEQQRRRREAQQHEAAAQRRDEALRAAMQEADEALRKAQEYDEEAHKKRRFGEEQGRQELRWKELKAVTRDERIATCLHSNSCKKVQHRKKFKCSACSAKRGMIAFECPHCSAFICQLCVATFSDKRKRLGRAGQGCS